ncbi:MAG: response regulator [Gemmatimonadetes bacterium]|nr:response regulator [Gemmatimonadota bacterium]
MVDRTLSGRAGTLIVGNQEPMLRLLRSALEQRGYAVSVASNAGEGLAQAREDALDLILVDAQVSDMEAPEFCRALRADPAVSPVTPILVVTDGEVPRSRRLELLRAGAWDCLGGERGHLDLEELMLKADAYVRAKLDSDRAWSEGLIDPVTGLYNRQGLVRRARELGAQAFRHHDALACVALSLELEPTEPHGLPPEDVLRPAVMQCGKALQSTGRPSDPVGRLAVTEFAVLAPATDATGAAKMAERLCRALRGAAQQTNLPRAARRVTAGYEAVANLGYSPMDPMELLARATAALRTARADRPGSIRRFAEED